MAIDTKASSGGKIIQASGVVSSFEANDLRLEFDPEDKEDLLLTLTFSFKTDSADPNVRIVPEKDGPHGLILHIFNTEQNVLGAGPSEPVKVAENKTSRIYLDFQVYGTSYSKSTWLHYTLFTEPKDDKN